MSGGPAKKAKKRRRERKKKMFEEVVKISKNRRVKQTCKGIFSGTINPVLISFPQAFYFNFIFWIFV